MPSFSALDAESSLAHLPNQPFRLPIQQPQAMPRVKRKNGGLDSVSTLRIKALASNAPSRWFCSVEANR